MRSKLIIIIVVVGVFFRCKIKIAIINYLSKTIKIYSVHSCGVMVYVRRRPFLPCRAEGVSKGRRAGQKTPHKLQVTHIPISPLCECSSCLGPRGRYLDVVLSFGMGRGDGKEFR